MKQLRLSEDLSLPLDAVTRRMAVLAMSGAGKSNVAVVLAEQMHAAGIPWVAIDPKGDWWGVRSSADGKSPGLSVPIFGGLHGDLPLEPGAGAFIAELIVDRRLTCVLDVSEFDTRQEMWRFLADFGETLLRRNREPRHLLLEEADEYIPQKTSEKGNLLRCLGVWQRVVKKGRTRGLGSTQITQRSASLNKDTLYQAEVLFALRTGGKGDRNAVAGWVEYHSAGDELVRSLPTLRDGEGWVSSPAWLRTTQRVQFLRRSTFDSGATPVLVGKAPPPATLADVDLDEVRESMRATIERAEADDPALLRARLSHAESELARARAERPPAAPAELIEVPVVLAADLEALTSAIAGLDEQRAQLGVMLSQLEETRASAVSAVDRVRETVAAAERLNAGASRPRLSPPPVVRPAVAVRDRGAPAPRMASQVATDGDGDLPRVQAKILAALAELELLRADRPERKLVALLSGYRNLDSKGFRNALSSLSSAGLVAYGSGDGTVFMTPAGREVAVYPAAPRTSKEIQARIIDLLGNVSGKILRPLIAAFPNSMERDEVAALADYGNSDSKGFRNALSRLSSLGFVSYPERGLVVAEPVLFLQGGAPS